MHKHKVWDLPVRICHWGFVIIIVFQYLSAEILNDDWLPNTMQWHFYAGYTCIGLLIFRLCWGLFGTYYAKFSQFMVSPSLAFSYLIDKNTFGQFVGHNPAGAYSIVVLMTLLFSQAFSGLFVSDEIFTDGPYYGVLGDTGQSIANFLHHNVFNILLGFIGLHILTIVYYKFKHKDPLTKAMLTGNKELTERQNIVVVFPWIGFIVSLLITALALYLLIEVLPPAPVDDFYGY